ncbi:28121_t:CDS:2, partial [Gigaspora margarita]
MLASSFFEESSDNYQDDSRNRRDVFLRISILFFLRILHTGAQ